MRGLGKMGLGCGGKMGLECGEEVKEKEFSQNFRQHIYIYILEKLVNMVIDMEVGEGNLSIKKKVSAQSTQNSYDFPH